MEVSLQDIQCEVSVLAHLDIIEWLRVNIGWTNPKCTYFQVTTLPYAETKFILVEK